MTAATTNFVAGDGTIVINQNCVAWVKLKMTYNGTGAVGGTPSFYLSEIMFYGN
jgi:hypothetical protein